MREQSAVRKMQPTEDQLATETFRQRTAGQPGGRGATRTLFGPHALHRIRLQLKVEIFLAKLRGDEEWMLACQLARETVRNLFPEIRARIHRAAVRAARRRPAA